MCAVRRRLAACRDQPGAEPGFGTAAPARRPDTHPTTPGARGAGGVAYRVGARRRTRPAVGHGAMAVVDERTGKGIGVASGGDRSRLTAGLPEPGGAAVGDLIGAAGEATLCNSINVSRWTPTPICCCEET
jgi:hypothetical protein